MTQRSAVYKDDDGYVILVAHGKDNPLVRLGFELTGLLHYCRSGETGKLEIFDGTNDVFYTMDGWWEGIDETALDMLDNAIIWGNAAKVDDRYFNAIELYASAVGNDLVREALS